MSWDELSGDELSGDRALPLKSGPLFIRNELGLVVMTTIMALSFREWRKKGPHESAIEAF